MPRGPRRPVARVSGLHFHGVRGAGISTGAGELLGRLRQFFEARRRPGEITSGRHEGLGPQPRGKAESRHAAALPIERLAARTSHFPSTLKLSWKTVVSPFALTVTWKVSWTRKLFPGPGPIMRKLLIPVNETWPFCRLALKWLCVTPVP